MSRSSGGIPSLTLESELASIALPAPASPPAPASAPAPVAQPRRSVARGVWSTARPRQWAKNVLVLAAPAAAGTLKESRVLLHVGLALVAFCLLSSATYLLNDVLDRNRDRAHPTKRLRPVAAGLLAPSVALAAAAPMALSGLALATLVRPLLGGVALG
jgi:decaprenyl-phosphate phosphoribosyltransferase